MGLEKSYDRISTSYDDNVDTFNLITSSRSFALQQIRKCFADSNADLAVLDLGVGSGEFLLSLKDQYPQADFTGLDISAGMLKIAQSKIPHLHAIKATVHEAQRSLKAASFDLLIAHFVLAYVELRVLLKKAYSIMRSDGILSIVSTTYTSFPAFQAKMEQEISSGFLKGSLLRALYHRGMQKTSAPQSYEQMRKDIKAAGFTILHHQQISTAVYFDTAKAMADFAIKGGWLLNAVDYPWIPTSIFYHLVHAYFKQAFTFPVQDQHIVEVLLVQPKNSGKQYTPPL